MVGTAESCMCRCLAGVLGWKPRPSFPVHDAKECEGRGGDDGGKPPTSGPTPIMASQVTEMTKLGGKGGKFSSHDNDSELRQLVDNDRHVLWL